MQHCVKTCETQPCSGGPKSNYLQTHVPLYLGRGELAASRRRVRHISVLCGTRSSYIRLACPCKGNRVNSMLPCLWDRRLGRSSGTASLWRRPASTADVSVFCSSFASSMFRGRVQSSHARRGVFGRALCSRRLPDCFASPFVTAV